VAITLTDAAADALRQLMAEQQKENSYLRVWVAGGGCSGLSYGMALDDNEPEADDKVFDHAGVRILIDEMSLHYMDGSSVDFVSDTLGGGFKIENPNAVSSCGCGSSFKTEDSEGASGGGCGSCGCRS
jgi:iron-sulfur cluster assembly accessory protein